MVRNSSFRLVVSMLCLWGGVSTLEPLCLVVKVDAYTWCGIHEAGALHHVRGNHIGRELNGEFSVTSGVDQVNVLQHGTIEDVRKATLTAIEKGLCRYGVLPIENSSAGSVTEVYDLMAKHKFYIVKSLKLHINHALLAKPGVKLEDVHEIISHSQALQQCSNFLKAHPGIKVTIFVF